MSRPILILSPTELEISHFRHNAVAGCVVETCGIGAAEAAAATASAIMTHKPRIVILTGIAGAYSGSGLTLGEAVLVDRERIADMGAFRAEGFKPMFAKEYTCPYLIPQPNGTSYGNDVFRKFAFAHLIKVGSNSVSACAAPYVHHSEHYKIENMEGAAFFAVCTALGTPFIELRTISNSVGAPPSEWKIPLAAEQLSENLIRIINEINS